MSGMSRDIPALLRFLAVGGGFSVGYSLVTAGLVSGFGFPPYLTGLVLFALCIPLAFNAHRIFSFQKASPRKSGFAIYASMQITSFALVSAITTRAVTGHMILDTGVYLVTVGTAAVLTFVATKLFVFRT